MESFSRVTPSFGAPVQPTTRGNNVFNSTNSTIASATVTSVGLVVSASTRIIIQRGKGNSSSSTSNGFDNLFAWVLISCIVLAMLMVISIFMVIVCWTIQRRRRSATVTDIREKGVAGRKGRRTNFRKSIHRVFESDGPLYAVSSLNGSRYTGLPETQNKRSPESARSSEGNVTPSISLRVPDELSRISMGNQKIIYQRYLTPVEGVPTSGDTSPGKEVPSPQPADTQAEDTYLQPVHGIPTPDGPQRKTSTPKPSTQPIPSPKPTINRKV